ncbi:hypothetical protein BAUCODRAFT_62029, partial [Baudoinia panamericana UAMH 10762]
RSGLAAMGAALSYFLTVGFLNAFGIFQQYYKQTVLSDKTDFQISWLGSFASFAIFAFAPIAGILADRIGPTLPIAVGSVAVVLAVFMTSLCKQYWQFFLAQGVLFGFGASFTAVPASGMVPRYFQRNRGLATGITIGGSSLGGILWPVIFDQLLHNDKISFEMSMRIAGFVMLPLWVICVLTIRPPLKQPEKLEDGVDLSALGKPPFILLCCGLFFALFGFTTPLYFTSAYAVSLGMSPSLAFYLSSILNGASLFGRVLPGVVADRWGKFNMLAASAFAAGIVAFCWTAATSVAGVIVWAIMFGFTSGAILSLQIACATTLADKDSAGAAVGIAMGSTSLAMLFGSPIAGQLVDYGYLATAMWSGAAFIVGAGFLIASRLSQDRSLGARI